MTAGKRDPHAWKERADAPRRPRTVLVLMVAFRWDPTLSGREVLTISRGLHGYPFKPAMSSKRQIAFVVQTDLSVDGLMMRMRELLSAGCVENAWAFTPGADVASLLPFDALVERIAEAWVAVRRYNSGFPKHRLPSGFFNRSVPMADGRGEVITTILDGHPLARRAERRNA